MIVLNVASIHLAVSITGDLQLTQTINIQPAKTIKLKNYQLNLKESNLWDYSQNDFLGVDIIQ